MKINWKVLVSLGLVIVAAYWVASSVLTRTYNGTNLNVDVGSGTVTVTNPSDEVIPVQLIGTGTRPFTISNTIEGVTGSSKRDGNGSAARQLLEFGMPPGVHMFNVVRGTGVKFAADSDTRLEAVVEPLSESDRRTTLIVGILVIVAGLYFASSAVEHRWLRALRRKPVVAAVPATLAEDSTPKTVAANRGRDGRAYSDS